MPTEQQINNAEQLQSAGLCQNSKFIIINNEDPARIGDKIKIIKRETLKLIWKSQGIPEGHAPRCFYNIIGPFLDLEDGIAEIILYLSDNC